MSIQDYLKNSSELDQLQVTAIQAQSQTLLDFVEGSVDLAYVQGNTTIALVLESALVYLYAVSRAATSKGVDLDSFILQFSKTVGDKFYRLLAVSASGNVTFSRYTTTQQAVIPASSDPNNTTQVATTTGNIIFNVIVDTSNPNWSSSLGGYVIPVGTASISVPVQAALVLDPATNTYVSSGTAGNVAANQINMIVQGIPFVNNVTNPTAFANGVDIESDEAYRARFQLIINSMAEATLGAYEATIESVQDGILYNILENTNSALQTQLGFNSIIIDDGSGSPPDSLLDAVDNALQLTRGGGVQIGVYATTPITVNIALGLLLDPTFDPTLIQNAVTSTLTDYINNLDVAEPLSYFSVPEKIYPISEGILGITGLQLNSALANVVPAVNQSVKIGTITFTITNP